MFSSFLSFVHPVRFPLSLAQGASLFSLRKSPGFPLLLFAFASGFYVPSAWHCLVSLGSALRSLWQWLLTGLGGSLSVYIGMYVYLYVCNCRCGSVYMSVYVYLYVYIFLYIYVYIFIYICLYVKVPVSVTFFPLVCLHQVVCVPYSFPGCAVLLCFSRLRSTQWVFGGACFIWLDWMLLLPEVLPS